MAEKEDKLDGFLSKMDAFMNDTAARLDSMEKESKERADAACAKLDAFEKKSEEEKEKADKARADAAKKDAEEEEEKKKVDAAKKDAEEEEKAKAKADADEKEKAEKEKTDAADVSKRIAAIEAALPKARTDADRASLISVQAKYDPLYHAFGDSAPSFMNGETVQDYRIRLASNFKDHSPVWKAANLSIIAGDAAALDAAEQQIYTDAMTAANTPATVAEGEIRMVPGRSESGHKTNRFVGDPRAAFARFTGSRRAVMDMTNTLQKYSNERRGTRVN